MPVSFLSAAQRERYGRYRGNPAADELARYFHLDDADRAAIGYRALTDRKAGFALARWLYAQCWTGTDRLSALFGRATSWMLAQKVLLPGASVLERFVARLRDRVDARLCRLLAAQLSSTQRTQLERRRRRHVEPMSATMPR